MHAAPLILTLALDEASFARFDGLRRRHFPAERNFIPAHLTLFHHLPAEEERSVLDDLRAACAALAPFDLSVTGLRSLGRGVAFTLESRDLASLRAGLARRWEPWLGPQDRQKHQPHVTVQNKADPADARALLEELRAGFAPFTVRGEGLHLWRYRGGPWEAAATVRFGG
jgi:2'-5' RNA ligase